MRPFAPLAAGLAGLCLVALAPAVNAADVRVSGMGVRKCTEWVEWKAANNGQARATTLEWAQGFIAGHNVYARIGRDNAPSVVADAKILVTLLDSYCEKNPDQRIVAGIIGITQSLGGAKLNLTPKAPAQPNPRPDDKSPRES